MKKKKSRNLRPNLCARNLSNRVERVVTHFDFAGFLGSSVSARYSADRNANLFRQCCKFGGIGFIRSANDLTSAYAPFSQSWLYGYGTRLALTRILQVSPSGGSGMVGKPYRWLSLIRSKRAKADVPWPYAPKGGSRIEKP